MEVTSDILSELEGHPNRDSVIGHPFLRYMRTAALTRKEVALILGQYWHPIHYFTEFLPRTIAVVRDLATRVLVTRILWQELGEGDPARAHETLYLETTRRVGFDVDEVRSAPALPAAIRLVEGYRYSTRDAFSAVGALYGTEVIDLAMVASVGAAIRNTTGIATLPWVDIHLKQEPNHVASVRGVVTLPATPEDRKRIMREAQQIWGLWSDFYQTIESTIEGSR
jgi:pyrroloquinoline quinone (PQQ) biosynthesis protein C